MLLPLNPFDSSLGTAILQLRVCDPWLSKGPRKWAKLVQRVQLKQQFKEDTGGKMVMSVWDAHSMTVDDVAYLEADDPLDERKRYRTIASRIGRVERIVSFKPHHARRNLIHTMTGVHLSESTRQKEVHITRIIIILTSRTRSCWYQYCGWIIIFSPGCGTRRPFRHTHARAKCV